MFVRLCDLRKEYLRSTGSGALGGADGWAVHAIVLGGLLQLELDVVILVILFDFFNGSFALARSSRSLARSGGSLGGSSSGRISRGDDSIGVASLAQLLNMLTRVREGARC